MIISKRSRLLLLEPTTTTTAAAGWLGRPVVVVVGTERKRNIMYCFLSPGLPTHIIIDVGGVKYYW